VWSEVDADTVEWFGDLKSVNLALFASAMT